jgi:hypothetical protein
MVVVEFETAVHHRFNGRVHVSTDRFRAPTSADETTRCSCCNVLVREVDSDGVCYVWADDNLGVLCQNCQDAWSIVEVKEKVLCERCARWLQL